MSHPSARIKVLHVLSGDLWAGAEVQAFNLLTSLQRFESFEISAITLNEGELSKRLRQQNIPVTVLDENTLSGLRIGAALHKYLRVQQPDIIHTHRFKENILGAIANLLSSRAACLRTTHGAPESQAKGWRNWPKHFLTGLDRWCGNNLQNRIIAVTAELADKLQKNFGYRHVTVIENGIDFDALFKTAVIPTTLQFDVKKIHIAIIGRLTPVKRIDLFLEIAAFLQRHQPQRHWQFHVFGDGPLRSRLQAQARALNVQDIVLFHGQRDDITACMSHINALVMCSDHEGLPMTLLEAMAIGTPIAGHAVGGIAQLLQGEACGWPVHNQLAISYATAITDILDNPSERQLRTIAAKDNVLKHYSAQLCAQKHVCLYQELTHS